MKMKKFVSIFTGIFMAVSLTSCGGTDKPDTSSKATEKPTETTAQQTSIAPASDVKGDVVKIQIGYENNTSEPAAIAVEKWKELVEERSNGTIQFELFPNSALGNKTELIDQMLLGEPIITVADGAYLADYGASDFGILYAPFLFDSWGEAWKTIESDWYKQLCDKLADASGLREVSSNWIYGARHLLTTKSVKTPDDLKGMKIRVSSNDIQIKSFEQLGAAPVGMEMGDVYQSLQSGTIDGLENPISPLCNRSFQEVAKNLLKDGHILAISIWICGDDFFQTLTPEQQKILTETADEAGLYNNDLQADAEAEATQKMIDEGVTITELTDEELQAWKDKAMPFYERGNEFGWSENLYETIKATMK